LRGSLGLRGAPASSPLALPRLPLALLPVAFTWCSARLPVIVTLLALSTLLVDMVRCLQTRSWLHSNLSHTRALLLLPRVGSMLWVLGHSVLCLANQVWHVGLPGWALPLHVRRTLRMMTYTLCLLCLPNLLGMGCPVRHPTRASRQSP